MPVALVLIMAIVAAFGLASTSVADDSKPDPMKYLNEQEVKLTVTDVEKGVTGTAYQYMEVNWDTTKNRPLNPEYRFNEKVAKWMKNRGGGSRLLSSTSKETVTVTVIRPPHSKS